MNHAGLLNEWLVVSQIVGYTGGTVIVVLLFVLVRRAARFDDTQSYDLMVWSALLWNAGNLARVMVMAAGVPAESGVLRAILAITFCGAVLFPAGALSVWQRPDPRSEGATGTWLVRTSLGNGVALALLMWSQLVLGDRAVLPHAWLFMLAACHVAIFLAVGALRFYRGHVTIVAERVAMGMTVAGAFGVGLSVLLEKGPLSGYTRGADATVLCEILRQMATHLMTLGALFFFARFRFADVFIRQSVRLIVAALLGVLCMALVAAALPSASGLADPLANAVALAVGALVMGALLASFTLVDRLIVAVVDSWLFKQPDYDAALRRLRDDHLQERADATLHAATVRIVSETLGVQARTVSSTMLPPSVCVELSQCDVIHGDRVPHPSPWSDSLGALIPIRTSGVVSSALSVTPRRDHPTFLARELEFLRAAAAALGHRLDVVRREREEIERRTLEANLQQQLSEATLRALQAQVNPHFLFNTLNTIAHLIQDDPPRAESMTLRLAEVFSHVLTRSHRPFSSVSEEMEFLRTYLTIEEARFGERLRVAFAVEPAAACVAIPSLILQPAVENALKHGFARKIGPGHLRIAAAIEDDVWLRLSVEDDGVGPASANGTTYLSHGSTFRASPAARHGTQTPRHSAGGVGLRNIEERLRTLYADRASLQFGPGKHGGSVVTLRLPLQEHDEKLTG